MFRQVLECGSPESVSKHFGRMAGFFWGGYRGHERSDMLLMEKAHSGLAEGRSQLPDLIEMLFLFAPQPVK